MSARLEMSHSIVNMQYLSNPWLHVQVTINFRTQSVQHKRGFSTPVDETRNEK